MHSSMNVENVGEWRRIYSQGRRVAELGQSIGSCPFKRHTDEHTVWTLGWEAGYRWPRQPIGAANN